jgi:hypothetical protein
MSPSAENVPLGSLWHGRLNTSRRSGPRVEAAVHKAKVLGLLIGTVDLALRMIKRVSFGTIIAGLLLPGALL